MSMMARGARVSVSGSKPFFIMGTCGKGLQVPVRGAENLGTGPVEVLTPASSATESASPAPFKTSSNWLRNFQRG